MRRLLFVAALVVAMGLEACASATPFVVAESTIDVAGEQFVTTSHLFDQALAAGAITPAQYDAWATFGRRFQQVYPSAVSLWEASIKVNDAALTGKASAILGELLAQLTTLYLQVAKVLATDGGAP